MNKYLALFIAVITGTELQAIQLAPRLVVNITIDQLRTDYLEAFTPLYNASGFRKLMKDGRVYDVASYPFSPVDNASAVSTSAIVSIISAVSAAVRSKNEFTNRTIAAATVWMR